VRQQSPHWWQSQFCTVGNDLTGIGIGRLPGEPLPQSRRVILVVNEE